MSVGKIIEISSTSSESFDDAVEQGIRRAGQTIHGIRSAWVKEMRVIVRDNEVSEYQVNLLITFLLDEAGGSRGGGGGGRRGGAGGGGGGRKKGR